MRLLVATVLVAACALYAGAAAAQTYPSKPVRMIVAFPPGGATDIVARIVSQKLSEMWGQQVFVDNRGGAAGTIGTDLMAKSSPDGYNLFMGTMGNLTANTVLYHNLPFDVERDLAPVTLVVKVHFVMVAYPAFPPKTVQELIALAKAKPGEINYASSGAGGAPHLGGELFKSMAGVNLTHVPYKGSGPSFADLLGGQVSLTIDSLAQALPYIKAGRLRALAVTGAKRASMLPDVPTVAESGVPGYELTNWFGLVTRAGTPREIINRVNADVVKVLQMPDVRERLLGMALDPVGDTPEQFGAYMKSETAKWARVIKEAGITAE
jgi:tripartite-type tricarboxylate transporter receptor subunit TctC